MEFFLSWMGRRNVGLGSGAFGTGLTTGTDNVAIGDSAADALTSGGRNTVVALDFGADKTSTSGDFVIQFPARDASNAIIRIA